MKEQSFAAMFKASPLAKWDLKVQSVKPSSKPLQYVQHLNDTNIDERQRPLLYGLKHDPPPRLWGRPLNYIKVRALDGEYGGNGLVTHSNIEVFKSKLLTILQNYYGDRKKDAKRLPVVGRVMNRTENGYSVVVAGLQAHLPLLEIPRHCQLSMEDIVRKRAFKFYVKEATVDATSNKHVIILSFYHS